jgi:hypothetical protein
MANSRVKWSVDLFSLNVGVDNNFATLNGDNLFSKLSNSGNFKVADFLKYNSSDKINLTLPMAEVRGPGFYISINDKHALSLTTRARVFSQFRGFSSNILL